MEKNNHREIRSKHWVNVCNTYDQNIESYQQEDYSPTNTTRLIQMGLSENHPLNPWDYHHVPHEIGILEVYQKVRHTMEMDMMNSQWNSDS